MATTSKYYFILLTCLYTPLLLAQGFENVAHNLSLEFSYETIDYGGGVSFVDFNQDGWDDLSFATQKDVPALFFINTGGSFEPIQLINETSATRQLLWLDYNNDGKLDLYLTSEEENKLYRNNGDLQMEEVTEDVGLEFPSLSSYCSTWFDYDNDGKLDLLVAHRTNDKNGNIDLYRNKDFNHFEKTTIKSGLKNKGQSVLAMTIIDYNNDGWQDIFLGQDWEKGNKLFENNGNGTFKDVSINSKVDFKMNSMTATVMDLNNDGWQDLYVSNTSLGNKLLLNRTDGTFEEQSESYNLDLTNVTFGTVFFDADNDGDDDVHIAGMQINHSFEYLKEINNFKKRNSEWGMFSDQEFNNGVAIGDYNNDGYIDIVKNSVTRVNFITSKNSFWENKFEGNNFLKIKLIGTISNRFSIGSKVSVYSANNVQHKRIACGESFSSQHSLTQHFGLNDAQLVDSIKVEWPSGNISTLINIQAGQTISISETLEGCTDPNACNYSPLAIADNGTCRYPEELYDCHGCISDQDEDGVCDLLEVYGCDEIEACNYSTEATENDGSCYYIDLFEISGPLDFPALKEVKYSYTNTQKSKYRWTIENGSILAGQNTSEITVIWFQNGTGVLSLFEEDEFLCKSDVVNLSINITDSIKPQISEIYLKPNPVSDILFVQNLNAPYYNYKLINSIGATIRSGQLTNANNNIDMSTLPSGVYYVTIENNKSIIIETIFKK